MHIHRVSEINSAFSEVNCLAVKFAMVEDILVCCIYNTNADSKTKLFKLLEIILDSKAQHRPILGYSNYPKIDWDIWTTSESTNSGSFKFIETVRNSYLYQHVSESTRIRGNETIVLYEKVTMYVSSLNYPINISSHTNHLYNK